jgi:ribA/ribD-fused uncharacterized protein
MTKHLHIFDEGGNPEVIAWFDDFDGVHDYMALSNFYEGEPLNIPWFSDEPFATGEHAFAAMKAVRRDEFKRIQKSRSPGEAKALGQACKLRPDWESVKYDVMLAVLREKFTLDRVEGRVLLSTGDALLIEGTYWEDMVWGVALFNDRNPLMAPGRNWLGTMLMARRAELKAERLFGHRHQTGAYNAVFATGK